MNICPLSQHTTHSKAIAGPPSSAKIYKDNWDFDLYVDELNSAISCEIFKHPSWIQFYYTWAGFQNYNLVARVNILDQQDPLFVCGSHFGFFFLHKPFQAAVDYFPLVK